MHLFVKVIRSSLRLLGSAVSRSIPATGTGTIPLLVKAVVQLSIHGGKRKQAVFSFHLYQEQLR